MAVRLRLMRMGKKKQPTYRVVAADSRSPRNGRFIEIIGTYQPRLEPSVVKIDNDRAVHWLKNGAKPSETVEKLLKISGAWADFKGEQFVAPEPPKPKQKGSAKKSAGAEQAEAPSEQEVVAEEASNSGDDSDSAEPSDAETASAEEAGAESEEA
ncbi:MAG TPA: 30S ribosomal protein S16 [Acidimicrobiaceae bacterium]|jgi:small subunit ribosomal protein S16|nr:30S ribosomal protein S16 [Acidimicrobiaceae bacterium]|tara:strand:- start:1233 stop:1697 length:465 start_codon:yes stop_codon:yes gene_type:complete